MRPSYSILRTQCRHHKIPEVLPYIAYTGRVAGQGMALASPSWTAYIIVCEFDGPKQSLKLSKIGYGFTIVVVVAYTEFSNPSSETWVSKILENYGEQRSVYFVFICPKQGPKMEGVVLNRVGVLELSIFFVLNRVRVSDPQQHSYTQTWFNPPPPGHKIRSITDHSWLYVPVIGQDFDIKCFFLSGSKGMTLICFGHSSF